MNRRLLTVVFSCVFACAASEASASQIADRTSLNALLGSAAITEAFETFTAPVGNGTNLGTTSLDATSIVGGQGPGLIVPGLRVSTSTGSLIWQGAGFFSIPTQTMATDPASDLSFDFLLPVTAFGMDLLNYGGFPATSQVTVFAADDVTVLAVVGGLSFPSAVTPIFFGYESSLGIGRVRVDSVAGFGPVVDNMTFGEVPEPASMTLLSLGLAGIALRTWRRKRS